MGLDQRFTLTKDNTTTYTKEHRKEDLFHSAVISLLDISSDDESFNCMSIDLSLDQLWSIYSYMQTHLPKYVTAPVEPYKIDVMTLSRIKMHHALVSEVAWIISEISRHKSMVFSYFFNY